MKSFHTLPAGKWQQTLIVQKSRFLAFATRVETAAAAQEFIKSVALPDATHHCYAYLTADGQKSNDNGEPSGTAGLPILQAIKGAGLFNVAVAVERYFGGIKLGTGGLARAYGQATSQVLSSVPAVTMRECVLLSFSSTYDQQAALTKLVQKHNGKSTLSYQDTIVWRVALPTENQTTFVQELGEIMRTVPVVTVIEPATMVEFND